MRYFEIAIPRSKISVIPSEVEESRGKTLSYSAGSLDYASLRSR
jgi:hypothetical protein